MSFSAVRGVVFDLDGTLVDSAPDLATAVDCMLTALDREPVGEDYVRRWIGNGARRLVARSLTGGSEHEPPPALLERAVALFFESYAEHLSARTRAYPGVVATLRRLSAAGFALGVVTNKPARFTVPLLTELGLARYFAATVSGDTLAVKKPDPEPLLHLASALGLVASDCVMVGDSITDVNAARRADMGIVCVTYGYHGGDDIRHADPDALVDVFTELLPLFGLESGSERASGHGAG